MRILYLPAYFYPEHAASSYLSENRDKAFADAGFEMEVYTTTPCRGISKEVRAEYCKPEHTCEKMYNQRMTVHRFSMFIEGNNPIMRAFRYVLCWMKQFYFGLGTKDIDIIFLASTPPIQGLLGAFLKKLKNVHFVYNLQDIFPDSMVGAGLAKKGGFIWKIGRVIENFTYRNADKIIVISEDFKKNIMAKGVPEEKIEVIYNWVDQNVVVNVNRKDNKLFDKYNLDRDKFYIEYSGNIGLTQNMDMLMIVMEELQVSHPDIKLVLVGEGAYKAQVEKLVVDKRLKNVVMLPFQQYDDISHVFSLGDVGLVISKPGVGGNSVPSKTWSIMSASRPVLANFNENAARRALDEELVDEGFNIKNGIDILTIGAIRDFSSNVELIKAIVNQEGFTLRFVGRGQETSKKLKQYCGEVTAKNVTFIDSYNKPEEVGYVKSTTFMNIFYPRIITHDTALSNRFYNSLIHRKPMIVTKYTCQGNYASDYNVGVVIEDCNNLINELKQFLQQDYKEYCKRCNVLLQSFLTDQEEFVVSLKSFINK